MVCCHPPYSGPITISSPIADPNTPSDETTLQANRRFLIQVEPTLESLSKQEDTDGNMQITIEDHGPKVLHTHDTVLHQ